MTDSRPIPTFCSHCGTLGGHSFECDRPEVSFDLNTGNQPPSPTLELRAALSRLVDAIEHEAHCELRHRRILGNASAYSAAEIGGATETVVEAHTQVCEALALARVTLAAARAVA